ncbi:Grx4 family monothiol glutaredoxin [Pneumocystis carinii B80]|uniref:Glutaredoxin n=1 Tax=Pneumocystis carinii (strain B80) TaxID=1408658 RepID=A0A0W4ZEF7_PNEC8|nr:Grx4 family monothiol glutaredoxin [Pneumocystis carinii B80]KTW26739.1 Grx4 family monothiol glutaredoxin [Pneumocystis carinii B80]
MGGTFFSREICHKTRANIQNLIKASPVVLFMKGTPEKPLCGFSSAAIHILNLFSINPTKFITYNVLEDDKMRQGIKEYSNWPTIPQLYIDNEFIGGCDILLEIYKNGELERLLNKAGVLKPDNL